MPLSFLAPIFLGALAVLAVPVLVHLIQRERRDAIAFPSLMFLSQVPYRSVRRRRIRNWVLFLLRAAALVLLAAAFARPLVDREITPGAGLSAARELVILLDRSYSMGYGDRWTRAVAAAGAAIDGVSADDRATLVFFDAAAVASNQPTADGARLRAALGLARPGSGVTRYGPALKLAQSLLEASTMPRREVVLISDFQRAGWDGGEGIRLPPGTELTTVPVQDADVRNVAVSGVTFRREAQGGRERVAVTARLSNTGPDPVTGLEVALELDGREQETQRVDVAAGDAASVTFPPFTLAESTVRGTVRSAADPLEADDAFHFVLSAGQAVEVLVADAGAPRSSLYLENALAIGELPGFRTDVRRGSPSADAIAGRDVVVLNDLPVPGGDAGRRLRAFVEGGGGLVVVFGPRSANASWDAAADLIGGGPGAIEDAGARGVALGYIEYGHPVFELFRTPRSGDLAAARVFRYRRFAEAPGATVLARFENGAPALVETRIGAGRVLVWATTLDTFWGDLPLKPVFLPFVHRLVRHAAGYAEDRPWFTAGQYLDVSGRDLVEADSADAAGAAAPQAAAPQVAADEAPGGVTIAPDGGRDRIPETGLLALEQQGFYEIRGDEGPGRFVAVNLDLSESDLSALDPEVLAAAVRPRSDAPAATGADPLTAEEREQRQSLWWYLLLSAFLVLAAETVLSNRLSRPRATAS
jgi:hypothetical protein